MSVLSTCLPVCLSSVSSGVYFFSCVERLLIATLTILAYSLAHKTDTPTTHTAFFYNNGKHPPKRIQQYLIFNVTPNLTSNPKIVSL